MMENHYKDNCHLTAQCFTPCIGMKPFTLMFSNLVAVEFLEKGRARYFNLQYWANHVMIQSPVSVTLLLSLVIVLFGQGLYNVEGTQVFKRR